jgi:hypothetical protein
MLLIGFLKLEIFSVPARAQDVIELSRVRYNVGAELRLGAAMTYGRHARLDMPVIIRVTTGRKFKISRKGISRNAIGLESQSCILLDTATIPVIKQAEFKKNIAQSARIMKSAEYNRNRKSSTRPQEKHTRKTMMSRSKACGPFEERYSVTSLCHSMFSPRSVEPSIEESCAARRNSTVICG